MYKSASNQPVGRAVTCLSGVGGLRFKSRASQIGHSVASDISLERAVLPGRNDVEMGPANSLHASAYYNKYN